MNKREEERMSMFYAVKKVCEECTTEWSGSVPMVSAMDVLAANMGKLREAMEIQAMRLHGVAMSKHFKREVMMKSALTVLRALCVLGVDSGNVVLLMKASTSRTRMVRARDTIVPQICQNAHDLGQANLLDLAPYGISAGELAALQAAIDSYGASIALPRAEMIVRMVATRKIDELVRATMRLLQNKMDRLVDNMESASPQFHQRYFDLRRLVVTGARVRKAA